MASPMLLANPSFWDIATFQFEESRRKMAPPFRNVGRQQFWAVQLLSVSKLPWWFLKSKCDGKCMTFFVPLPFEHQLNWVTSVFQKGIILPKSCQDCKQSNIQSNIGIYFWLFNPKFPSAAHVFALMKNTPFFPGWKIHPPPFAKGVLHQNGTRFCGIPKIPWWFRLRLAISHVEVVACHSTRLHPSLHLWPWKFGEGPILSMVASKKLEMIQGNILKDYWNVIKYQEISCYSVIITYHHEIKLNHHYISCPQ